MAITAHSIGMGGSMALPPCASGQIGPAVVGDPTGARRVVGAAGERRCLREHDARHGQAAGPRRRHRGHRAADRAEPGGIDDDEREAEPGGKIGVRPRVGERRAEPARPLNHDHVETAHPRLESALEEVVDDDASGGAGASRRRDRRGKKLRADLCERERTTGCLPERLRVVPAAGGDRLVDSHAFPGLHEAAHDRDCDGRLADVGVGAGDIDSARHERHAPVLRLPGVTTRSTLSSPAI
jgi:hypothetical protein